jgi:hypothetical protein
MARLLTSDQIIDLVNQERDALGFYIIEVADRISGYRVNAVFDRIIAGHSTTITFREDILFTTRYYDRDEVAGIIKMLAAIYENIIKELSTTTTKSP